MSEEEITFSQKELDIANASGDYILECVREGLTDETIKERGLIDKDWILTDEHILAIRQSATEIHEGPLDGITTIYAETMHNVSPNLDTRSSMSSSSSSLSDSSSSSSSPSSLSSSSSSDSLSNSSLFDSTLNRDPTNMVGDSTNWYPVIGIVVATGICLIVALSWEYYKSKYPSSQNEYKIEECSEGTLYSPLEDTVEITKTIIKLVTEYSLILVIALSGITLMLYLYQPKIASTYSAVKYCITLYASWILFVRSFFIKEKPWLIPLLISLTHLNLYCKFLPQYGIPSITFLFVWLGVYCMAFDSLGSIISSHALSSTANLVENYYRSSGLTALILGKTAMTSTGRAAIAVGAISGVGYLVNAHLERLHKEAENVKDREAASANADKQRDWASQEAQKQRDWDSQEAHKLRDWADKKDREKSSWNPFKNIW